MPEKIEIVEVYLNYVNIENNQDFAWDRDKDVSTQLLSVGNALEVLTNTRRMKYLRFPAKLNTEF